MESVEQALIAMASSPWLPLALYGLVVADAFLVILPSETAVVALGALAAASGSPSPVLLVAVAAVGALTGDLAVFAIGRAAGFDRWAWMRRGRVGAALARVRSTIQSRPAVLIFTARYIPYARIAVNLAAGASGLPLRRYLPLAALAGVAWACYNVAVGALFGGALPGQPVLAIALSVVVAVSLGVLVDLVIRRVAARRAGASDA